MQPNQENTPVTPPQASQPLPAEQPSIISPNNQPVAPNNQPAPSVTSPPNSEVASPASLPAPAPQPAPVSPSTSTPMPSAQPSPAPLQPAAPAGPPTQAVFGGDDPPGYQPQKPNDPRNLLKNPKLWIPAAAFVAVTLITLGVVFGYYLPNRPVNAYNTGVNRSGKAIEKIVESATEKKSLDRLKKSELTGNLNVSADGGGAKGNFSSKFDSTKLNAGFDFSYKSEGEDEESFSAKLTSQAEAQGQYPDSYLQLSGFSSFGLDEYAPGISEYDGKWLRISPDFLKSIDPEGQLLSGNNEKSITYEDVAELSKAIVGTTRDYVFSTDKSKAVLVQKEYVATEKVDDITAFHYKMGVNKENTKKYCEALIRNASSTQAVKKLNDGKAPEAKEIDDAVKDCNDSVEDGVNEEDTFDMWIDKKYKLIYKLRFTEKDNPKVYFDIGQRYKGGNSVTLFTKYSDSENLDVDFSIDIDTKKSLSRGTLTVKSTDELFQLDGKATFEAKPYEGDIPVEKPSGSVPIEKVLQEAGLDPAELIPLSPIGGLGSLNSDVGTKSKDTERQSDIRSIHGQLEAYYAQNGSYPTLAQLNNPAFRQDNLLGLDDEALIDPDGSAGSLAAAPAQNQYSYQVTCRRNDCQTYNLTATLSTGEKFTKLNLN